jgi:coproporphyrinogen III oxidase
VDARHFHTTLKRYCERHDLADYATMKAACDRYFMIAHRNEMRGIGGIFFDMLDPQGVDGFARGLAFAQEGIATILAAYLPVVRRRMATLYGERERQWQLYRRGRYVEFNLVYDKGTIFGLQTNGNIEAILMSMPPLARWEFQHQPDLGTPEADVARFLQPQDWAE